MTARVGIDFGGVIVMHWKGVLGEDTSLKGTDGYQVVRDGAYDAVRQIVLACDGRVWIVSKAGQRMQALTLAWLDAVYFFSRTGLKRDHVRFCLKREDKEKICRDLKINYFIDDRIHIMQILRYAVSHLYLFGDQGDEKFCPPWATFVSTWDQVVDMVTASIKKEHSKGV